MTAAEIRAEVNEVLPCWCDAAYKDRGLAAPDCPRCQFADDVVDLIVRLQAP